MMEVIPINTNEHAALKADLWAERIRAFQESGLSRKDWCQQNEIPQSTLSYWILMKRLERDAFHWPDTPDELRKVTLKEIHWLCDGLSLNPSGAFAERHPKIII